MCEVAMDCAAERQEGGPTGTGGAGSGRGRGTGLAADDRTGLP
jgi:hypothetical protein